MSLQAAAMKVMGKAIEVAPDKWMPGGIPDPLITHKHGHKGDLIGAPISRVDGPLKVRGAAPFAAEFAVPGMLFAAAAWSTIPKGRITTLNTAAAEAAPGVRLVMTHKNAPKLKPMPIFNSSPKAAGPSDLPIMQDDCIHWNGEAIAVILADTQEQADYAKSLIHAIHAEELARELEVIMGEPPRVEIGDAEAELTASACKVDRTYRTPRHNHNPIELHAVTLFWHENELYVQTPRRPSRRLPGRWRKSLT